MACQDPSQVQAKPGIMTAAQVMQLIINLGNRGVTRASLQVAIDDARILKNIANVICSTQQSNKKLKYGDLSIGKLIELGRYANVDQRISEENFNLGSSNHRGQWIDSARVEIVHTMGGLQETAGDHSTLGEFLMMAITSPEMQHGVPIVCMPTYAGSLSMTGVSVDDDEEYVPVIAFAGTERVLTLGGLNQKHGTLRLWGGIHTGPWAIAVA